MKSIELEMPYEELLKDYRWQNKRIEILMRDGYRCRNCKTQYTLQVHHRQYHLDKSGGKVMPWEYSHKYLITLCDGCHSDGHKHYKIPIFHI
jgi:5-methylcytosine-specific restriction endonuclease McrA